MRSLLIGVVVLAGVVLLLVVEGADTYHWHRTRLGETRRQAMHHAVWKVGL